MNNVILSESEENFTTLPFCCEETTKSFKTIRRRMFLRMRTKTEQVYGLTSVTQAWRKL